MKGCDAMLPESIMKLYRRLRLDGYRKLFGAVQEREGSLSAIEAFSADLINLLGEPTISQFAEYVGISQPNATYKVNALAAKGYVEKVVAKPDRREVRLRTGKKFAQYFDEDRPAILAAAESVRKEFTDGEIETARRVLDAMLAAMQQQKEGATI